MQVGVEHLARPGHQSAHPADGDVLLEGGAQAVDLVVDARPTASSPLAATRAASSSASATNSSALATKSVSQRSSTTAAASPSLRHGDSTLGRLAVAPLGRTGQALLAQELGRLVDVAVGLLERVLAVEHAGAGRLAQSGTSLAV